MYEITLICTTMAYVIQMRRLLLKIFLYRNLNSGLTTLFRVVHLYPSLCNGIFHFPSRLPGVTLLEPYKFLYLVHRFLLRSSDPS